MRGVLRTLATVGVLGAGCGLALLVLWLRLDESVTGPLLLLVPLAVGVAAPRPVLAVALALAGAVVFFAWAGAIPRAGPDHEGPPPALGLALMAFGFAAGAALIAVGAAGRAAVRWWLRPPEAA